MNSGRSGKGVGVWFIYSRDKDFRVHVHSERIPDDEFAEFLKQMPQVSVELVVQVDGGVLLAKRCNEPAAGEWFWPGTRLYKGESLVHAAHRLAEEELGVEVDLGEKLGVYSHFWDTGALSGVDSTHTVNVVFLASVSEISSFDLDEQHANYKIVENIEPDHHQYVKQYLRDLCDFK